MGKGAVVKKGVVGRGLAGGKGCDFFVNSLDDFGKLEPFFFGGLSFHFLVVFADFFQFSNKHVKVFQEANVGLREVKFAGFPNFFSEIIIVQESVIKNVAGGACD